MANELVQIGDFRLESGQTLRDVELAFEWAGARHLPIVLVCHALTGSHQTVGNEESPGWWSGLIGPSKWIDTNKFSVLSFNVLGGCHGSTGPTSIHPDTGEAYGDQFPNVSIRDMVHVEKRAFDQLGISHVHAIVGGSLGGMRTLEWSVMYPEFMTHAIPLAVTPSFSSHALAYNAIALRAIESDNVHGFEVARMIGMVTYRSGRLFEERFGREKQAGDEFQIASYLNYQGEKLPKRFDVNSYVTLLRAMNSFDIGEGRGGVQATAAEVRASVLCLSFANDLLYPSHELEKWSRAVSDARFSFVETIFGHDGFLTEFDQWGPLIKLQLEEKLWSKLKQPS